MGKNSPFFIKGKSKRSQEWDRKNLNVAFFSQTFVVENQIEPFVKQILGQKSCKALFYAATKKLKF